MYLYDVCAYIPMLTSSRTPTHISPNFISSFYKFLSYPTESTGTALMLMDVESSIGTWRTH